MCDNHDKQIIMSLPRTVMEAFYQKRFIDKGHADCPSYKSEWVTRFRTGYAWRLMDSYSRADLLTVLEELGFEDEANKLWMLV